MSDLLLPSRLSSEEAGTPITLSRTKAATRARLCEAARELFAQQGYGATSIEQIARAAGTRRSTLYTHFRDKDEILHAVMQDHLIRVRAAIGRLPAPRPTRAEVERWVRDLADLAAAEQAPTVLLMQTGAARDVPLATLLFGREIMKAFAERLPAFARASDPGREGELAAAWAQTVLRELGVAIHQHQTQSRLAAASLIVATDLLARFVENAG